MTEQEQQHIEYTLTQNENFTLFIMGFTIPEIKTYVPHNAGNEIQLCVGMTLSVGE